jgi:hypothetical protein
MRFSEAIALGSMSLKPSAGKFLNRDRTEGCAMGMAYVGMGEVAYNKLQDQLFTKHRAPMPCDCVGTVMGGSCIYGLRVEWVGRVHSVAQIIVHLFNYHVMTVKDWSMDKLIDWVRLVEPAEAEVAEVPVATPVVEEVLVHI